MSAVSGINRINISIPAAASNAASLRDTSIADIQTALGGVGAQLWHYSDSSPLGMWGYLAIMYAYTTQGILTVATVSCNGMAHPPDGSDLVAITDPGAGVYTWVATAGMPNIKTSGGASGISVPQGNNNYYMWHVPASGAPDFATAINAVETALASEISVSLTVAKRYYKYVDSVSGAWQVWAVYFGAGTTVDGASSPVVVPNNNILYVITCAGTPHPPTGSLQEAVTLPGFTETFVSLSAPLNFGPMR